MIRIKQLYKYYGTHRAVGPLSAEIERGEVVGLLGLNGAGKTTTLRVLACDLLPSSGSVEVDGVDVVAEPDRVRSMIGYLPDTPPLYEEMTVQSFLKFAAELRGVARGDLVRAVGAALEEIALTDVASSPIGALSHGYRQRVGIAQAIVHRPKLVVLDEPSSGLDPVQIKDMRRLVRGIGGERTVLVSSHNLPEISETCDRLLVIGQGQIVASGTEQELVNRLMSGERLELSVRPKAGTDRSAVRELVASVAGVTEVNDDAEHEDPHTLNLVVVASAEARPAIAKCVVEAGHELMTLARSRHELETVFAKLAQAGGATAESEAA